MLTQNPQHSTLHPQPPERPKPSCKDTLNVELVSTNDFIILSAIEMIYMETDTIINVFLLLFGALQGLILSFLILRKKFSLPRLFFALFILLATVQLFHKVVSKSWLMEHLTVFYKMGYEIPFLFGPVLLAYIATSFDPKWKWRWPYILHLIPFLYFATLRALFIYVFPYDEVLFQFLPFTTPKTILHGLLQLVCLWVYGILALQKIQVGAKSWFKKFIWTVLVMESLIIVALKLIVIYYGRYPDPRWLFLSLTALIYWVSYKMLDQGDQLILNPVSASKQLAPSKKYANSGLKQEQSKQIIEQLHLLLNQQQLYLNPTLSIQELAESLHISKHHLSQAINMEMDQSFYELINTYRVEAAKKMLVGDTYQKYTIAAIAYDSGFQSISNFNAVFKKWTETTPSQFRRTHLGSFKEKTSS